MPKPRIVIKLDGEDRLLADVCAEKEVPYKLAYNRLLSGWPPERLFLPVLCGKKYRADERSQLWGGRWVYTGAGG